MTKGRGLPFRITLLLWLVLIITALSAVRALTAIGWHGVLLSYLPLSTVYYIGITGAVWMLAGLFVLWSLLRRRRWARDGLLAAALSYTAWKWADRFFVQLGPRPNWLFELVLTALLLGFTLAVILDPRNLQYFGRESYERKPEKPPAS